MARAYSVVTGGSNGIGAAICRRLVSAGKAVINIDKVVPKDTSDGEYVYVQADLSNPSATRAVAADTFQK
jgi:NAD(P)-dependent dehydrogenase (short-subunit alcohol dehydrogenase family)